MKMIRSRTEIFRKLVGVHHNVLLARQKSSSSQINIEKIEQESAAIDVVDEEAIRREEEIEAKRNKSRLKPADRNFLLEENPYPEPTIWHHGTLKYMRRLYGRYGEASGVNPSICWPVKQELQETLEYENVAYPFTIPQMIDEAKRQRQEAEEKKQLRDEDVVRKMAKLEQWKQEFHQRLQKKEGEAFAAKERKERLIEEVRRHFGFTVDPKDERFKEMLEKKEKEQKKAMKEARKKAKEEKLVEKLLKKKVDEKQSEPVPTDGTEKSEK